MSFILLLQCTKQKSTHNNYYYRNKLFIFVFVCFTTISSVANVNYITSKGSYSVVTSRISSGIASHLTSFVECPEVFFESSKNCITINFGAQKINNFTVTITSMCTEVDYYATSSFISIPFVPDGMNDYTIIIEIDNGDIFEGTLFADEYLNTESI